MKGAFLEKIKSKHLITTPNAFFLGKLILLINKWDFTCSSLAAFYKAPVSPIWYIESVLLTSLSPRWCGTSETLSTNLYSHNWSGESRNYFILFYWVVGGYG